MAYLEDVKEHKIKFHEDDRAQRLQDVYKEAMPTSQINVSYINSTKHIVAWHKHDIQTDYWTVLKGSLKVGLARRKTWKEDGMSLEYSPEELEKQSEVTFEYLSDKNLRVLEIPPGIYHGYRALEPGTILCYYLTEKYNPDVEIRAEVGDFGEDWGTPNK